MPWPMASRSLSVVAFLGPVLPDGGYSGEEGGTGIPRRLKGQDFVGQCGQVVAEPAVSKAVVMGVAVDHPGHDSGVGEVERLD